MRKVLLKKIHPWGNDNMQIELRCRCEGSFVYGAICFELIERVMFLVFDWLVLFSLFNGPNFM